MLLTLWIYQVHDGEITNDENGELEADRTQQSIDVDEVEEVDDDYDYDDDGGVKWLRKVSLSIK